MRYTCKICSPFVPGLSGEAGRVSSDEAASRERVGNLRITPMRAGPGRRSTSPSAAAATP